jgi:hypothetical protein
MIDDRPLIADRLRINNRFFLGFYLDVQKCGSSFVLGPMTWKPVNGASIRAGISGCSAIIGLPPLIRILERYDRSPVHYVRRSSGYSPTWLLSAVRAP